MRLKPLTRLISGDDRPKQFCPLFDGRTLLDQTLRRTELVIPSEQVLVSLTAQHSKWYVQEPNLARERCLVQPGNKGTAPPVAHSLLSIARIDAQALVAVLPSDHHYSDEPMFVAALDSAFQIAEENPRSVVLLGAQPDYPEVEYGWIGLGAPAGQKYEELFHVEGFREKPPLEVALDLMREGSVWNTFVMLGRATAFLEMLESSLPDLMHVIRIAQPWEGTETHIEHCLYELMPASQISQQVLSVETQRLLALRLGPVGWSDLGDPDRALRTAGVIGHEAGWTTQWKRARSAARPHLKAVGAIA